MPDISIWGEVDTSVELPKYHLVIDNTPLPRNGAYPWTTLVTQTHFKTEFTMSYNIKKLAIYFGLVVLLLISIQTGMCYLYCKLKKDTEKKKKKVWEEAKALGQANESSPKSD